jgi:hypothetical protein
MMQNEIEASRQLAFETLTQLAERRRTRKATEAARDAATAAQRAALAAAELPFAEPLADLKNDESELVAMAVETLVDFDKLRRAELLAGRECAQLAPPADVRVDWKSTPTVPDVASLHTGYTKIEPDMKKLRAAVKAGTHVPGMVVEVLPTVVVGGE